MQYNDPQAYRTTITHAQGRSSVFRGPTLVMLPSGKEITVPRMARNEVKAPAEIHQALQGQGKLDGLMKLLAGKQGASAPAGFKIGSAPAFQRADPRQNPQLARHMGMNLAF